MPDFIRLPSVHLRTYTVFIKRKKYIIPTNAGENNDELAAVLKAQHKLDWKDDVGTKLFWRLVVLHNPGTDQNQLTTVWVFHHTISDGTSANSNAKKQREEVQLQRQVKLEEKRVERQRLKEIRELERAEKAAERARKVEAQHQKKATQQAQQRKRKASRAPSSKNKRQKRAMEDRARDRVASPPSPPPPKTTSRGRNVNLPQKFR
ncbi:hypothetical protein Ptr86124_009492 [Pyrenophora tritici-repentis]|uniref:Uncharacterized protein n=1 Tax=Pyrenophora tritici-repentis TaxID=45151 RepID=A0A922N8K1_9PLEO|nr:hypothetical protein Ptr86124_009492 [Pyrenophora tritici-repentis]